MKNRMHLDVNVGRENASTRRSRGSPGSAPSELWKVDQPGAFHTTMADPEGNEFCVQ